MSQMQSEMFAKANNGTEYPKIVLMPLGVVALANNKEEHDRYIRENQVSGMIMIAGAVLILLTLVAGVVFLALT